MARALVGITSHQGPARWGDTIREAVLSPASYCRALELAGALPVLVPPVPPGDASGLIRRLDALLLSGGPDVDPCLYGARRHPRTGKADSARDRSEVALARAAADAGLPMLAIGRGMHVLNVARGGTLIQHLPDVVGHDQHAPLVGGHQPRATGGHAVRIDTASVVGKALGEHAEVRGCHHQAVARLGEGLEAVAWADDQIVEAAELAGHPFGLAVQWHPEDTDDIRVVEAFVTAALTG
ncbi:MAG TPA: gamma-glutamyl-gamma-aminobutyrate hydrolase family protein [Streptosporangiaceae bacterium]|nr:gamma-glutamyl-gamma-aminobutyrate hydrolase family protein [Streptosporangiaceae bacterium]